MNLESKLSASLYNRLVDVMPYGIVVANAKSEFILHNTIATVYFNKEIHATTNTRWGDGYGIYTLDKKTRIDNNQTPIQKALRGETTEGEKFYMVTKTMPEGFYIKVSSYPIYGEDDKTKIEAGVVVFEDITKEQKFVDGVLSKITELEGYLKGVLNIDYDLIIKNRDNERI